MNILLISQCSKGALPQTRRILDQFAERKGDNTWSTAITQIGLDTLRKLLRKSARRNTAVACHWQKKNGQSELLWIVGNQRKFNEQGTVPTNSTSRDILRCDDENNWHTGEVIALLAGIAGLFHDIGKANTLFQNKLQKEKTKNSEPFRHEWVSVWLFAAFVSGLSDEQWLTKLKDITPTAEPDLLANFKQLLAQSSNGLNNPFGLLPPLAQTIAWLILSHHKLPQFPASQSNNINPPKIENLDLNKVQCRFNAAWNSPQFQQEKWHEAEVNQNWQFPVGTPIASKSWCDKAKQLAIRALRCTSLLENKNWLQDRFTSHLARLSLMLADHAYSASPARSKWQDPNYRAWANTDKQTKACKQKLDEHNVGVGHNALLLAKSLPQLKRRLPSLTRHKGFKKRSTNEAFRWQDNAYDLARTLSKASEQQGFFGINMASTGCGKTFANARIMYGLADEKLGCRFNVALGLRTLTLQTGDALRQRLHLDYDELAVLIGSEAVKQLHELNTNEQRELDCKSTGSDSEAPLFEQIQHIKYEGTLDDGPLRRWLTQSGKLHQLISAPIVVSTIDHLILATEGYRGGKQIAPMLRLLTSDLVLDEPDDFDLADNPALVRLVNWAGMLGSRVLLSSATLPPALICALFEAYQQGRQHYHKACGELGSRPDICCAWFDELGAPVTQSIADISNFKMTHSQFIFRRIQHLQKHDCQLRLAEKLPVTVESTAVEHVITGMACAIKSGITHLHQAHHQQHQSGKTISIGLVRMANINPMVAVSQSLLKMEVEPDTRIHFCIYHSQHPMLVRSEMEKRLDKALTRHNPDSIWSLPEVEAALKQPEQHHIFVVFATAVAEVGRDHDYDWAIAEPSSMRSLIQLAGRVLRHRKLPISSPNLLILDRNFKALTGKSPAFCKPGFESSDYAKLTLKNHDLDNILTPEQYLNINAIPRLDMRKSFESRSNLADLEHYHMAVRLFGSKDGEFYPETHAALWWKHEAHWCNEIQRCSRFRQSIPDESYVLYQEDENDTPTFYRLDFNGDKVYGGDESAFERTEIELADRIELWMDNDVTSLVAELAEVLSQDISDVSYKYTEIKLPIQKSNAPYRWQYQPWFGVYRTPK